MGLGQRARDRRLRRRRWCWAPCSSGAARWHRSPIIDLSLLRIRTFSAANGMTIVAAAGFYGYTLTNVLFLTGVWRYCVLQAGLALTPGPFVAAAVAGPTSRLAQRIGHRPVLVAGGLIWGGAVMWLVERVGVQPDFLGEWLPGIVLLGIGAGTLFPNLSGAAVASAPGRELRHRDRAELGRAPGRRGARRGRDRRDHRHAVAAAGAGRVRPRLDVRGRLPVHRRPRLPARRAGSSTEAPSLGDAARLVLRRPRRTSAPAPPPPRARRAITRRRRAAGGSPAPRAAVAVPRPRRRCSPDLEPALREQLRRALASRCGSRAGEWLFHEGDPGDAMYIVRAGRLEVVDESSGAVDPRARPRRRARRAGAADSSPRSASVRAARASDLLAIDRRALRGAAAELAGAVAGAEPDPRRAAAQQPGRGRRARGPRPATVALLSLDERVPIGELARGARRGAQERARHRAADRPGARSGRPPGEDPARVFAPLLDRAEAATSSCCSTPARCSAGRALVRVLPAAGRPDPRLHRRRRGPRGAARRGASCRAATWSATTSSPGRRAAEAWAAALERDRVSRGARGRADARRRPDRAAAQRQLGRRRPVGRRRPRLLAHRRAGGADRRRRDRSTASSA